jgi:hypothetical protein
MQEDTIIALLLGERLPRIVEMEREGIVPSYLVAPYARESAAREASEFSPLSPKLTAALLQAAFGDEEEDVRAAAKHTLILCTNEIGNAVHLSLTLDSDPFVRETAFDEAIEVTEPERRLRLIRQAADALIDDDCEFVRARAEEFREAFK